MPKFPSESILNAFTVTVVVVVIVAVVLRLRRYRDYPRPSLRYT